MRSVALPRSNSETKPKTNPGQFAELSLSQMIGPPTLAHHLTDLPRAYNGNVLHRFNQPFRVVRQLHFPEREYNEVYIGFREGQGDVLPNGNTRLSITTPKETPVAPMCS